MDELNPITSALERVLSALQDSPLHPQPHVVNLGGQVQRCLLVVPDESHVVDLTKMVEDAMPFLTVPKGEFKFGDLESFSEYVTRYKTETSTIYWAGYDLSQKGTGRGAGLAAGIMCVFDEWRCLDKEAPYALFPRRQWRALLQLEASKELNAWLARDEQKAGSAQFAEFIESNIDDIPEPMGQQMLTVSTQIQGKRTLQFKAGVRLDNGMVDLQYVEGGSDSVGSGKFSIPQVFTIAIPVFEGMDVGIKLQARFKYRLQQDGNVLMWYELVRPWKAIELAVLEQVEKVRGLGLPVYREA